jgi:tetratricopeptide (TPR) repeat protein
LQYYRYQDYNNAEKYLRQVILADRHHPLAFHYLGRLLFEKKRFQEGETIMKMALENYLPPEAYAKYYDSIQFRFFPDTCMSNYVLHAQYPIVEDKLRFGLLYERWGHLTEAENMYRQIIEGMQAEKQAWLRLGNLLETTARYADAEALFKNYSLRDTVQGIRELNAFYGRMMKAFPDKGEWYYKAGDLLYGLAKKDPGKYSYDKKMIDEYSDSVVFVDENRRRKMPKLINPLVNGAVLENETDTIEVAGKIEQPFTDGIEFFTMAAERMQADEDIIVDVNYKTGELYVWQGLPGHALSYFEKYIEARPGNANARSKLIELYAGMQRYREAIVQLDSLKKRQEINLTDQLLLAKYYMHDGRFSAADSLLKAAEKNYPYVLAGIIELKGKLQFLSGHYKEALVLYQQLAGMNKNDAFTSYTMARLYAKLGRSSEAWQWLEASLNKGFNYSFVLRTDMSFTSLRKTGKWLSLLNRYHMKEYGQEAVPVEQTEN